MRRRNGRSVFVSRLEDQTAAVEGHLGHFGVGFPHVQEVGFEPGLHFGDGVEAVRDLEALDLGDDFGHARVFVEVDDGRGVFAGGRGGAW